MQPADKGSWALRSARALAIFSVAALFQACDKSEEVTHIQNIQVASDPFEFYVDARRGNDANPGTSGFPFKTITRALAVAFSGETVKVEPGTYDTANGETFPIAIPAGVTLIGDEANKGVGAIPTQLIGSGAFQSVFTTVHPDANSTIAGFRIVNNGGSGTRDGLVTLADNVTVRNNTFDGSPTDGMRFGSGSDNQVIVGNIVINHAGTAGIYFFVDAGNGAKLENNIIRDNNYGIIFSPDFRAMVWDLGGGPTGSVGGNEISCNTTNDLLLGFGFGQPATVHADNNLWDHVPPSANDISAIPPGYTVTTAGAGLSPNPCP